MFDSYSVNMPKTIEVNSRVIEQRAPTDESVRLLHEMQNKIAQDFINRAPLVVNNIRVDFVRSYGLYGEEFGFAVNINGHKKFYKYEYVVLSEDNLVEYLMKKFAEDLAGDMLMSLSDADKTTLLKLRR